ncbi:phytoene desaturase family protein [Streptomyces sp. TP-A0874]|uniref:phytoene desaturase family protein n=1 Tax=Streptomyces sp. TP-A0874 TaxID=549819 RepID=UPI00085325ED|nr:NAD(P)/FAD-dependent oxidoreductase [Streptomyces sp. TP-A0874]
MSQIVVIGAGMGAMAAAARLATAGHRVKVFERSETPGGAVRRLERDGFAFDTGPGLLHLPAVYRDLFLKTGREPLEQCVALSQVDPAARHLFPDGTDLRLPNASRAGVTAALDAAFGTGSGARWGAMLNRAREVWDATRRPLLEEPLRNERLAALGRDPYPAAGGGPLRRPARSLAEVAGRELRDPRLGALLESYALAHGLDPRETPAGAVVLPYLEQTFGSWYVAGGLGALADALWRRCRDRKVEFVFGAEVVRILERGGRAAGVELADGGHEEADLVVCGVDPRRLPGLLGASSPTQLWGEVGVRPAERRPAGRFTVLLALGGARPAGAVHRTVVHAGDREAELAAVFGPAGSRWRIGRSGRSEAHGALCERPTVTVLRPDDPAGRPDAEHEAVTLQVTVAAHASAGAPADSTAVDWAAPGVAEGFADRVVEVAEAAVPGLAGRLLWREVVTPADTAAVTGSVGGAVPAPALAGAGGRRLLPANATGLPGLYSVGGWSHPGGGLAHAGMSGALVAGLIVEGADWRGSY